MSEFDKKVLFCGDSITRHYFPYTEEYLAEHEVQGIIPEKWTSCQWKQLRYMKGAFIRKRRYDGRKIKADWVHFNFGLHCIKLPDKGHGDVKRAPESDFETYEAELIEEVEKIIWYGSKPLFSNTTPNPKNAGMRNDLDVVRLNEIALTVMKKFDVPHNDLYGFVKSQEDYPTLYMHPRAENNCHFLEHGRELLGKQVAQFVLDNM